jgi:TonB family protein
VQKATADNNLDFCADLTWQGLLKPQRDAVPNERTRFVSMTFVKELSLKAIPGREYTFTIDNLTGTAQFFVTQARAYVLVAMGSVGGSWTREPFFSSFAIDPGVPLLPPAAPEITGPNDLTDAQQVFKSSQVTERARVLEKPEPSYTESARIFSITGTVVLRAIFSSDGHVTNLVILKRLPHGLTEKAVKAAQAIRFTPAVKDGKSVSMWMQLEYNFNLY